MSGQSGGHRLRLSKLNEQLTCKLCGGYFIDATTIIECLHSFCRSCIVKYLESNKYCPICEVQVHKSRPLLNIRPDHTLQDIVYKLVPGCYQNEMRCRREFYLKHPEARNQAMSPESRGEPIESHIYSPDESLSLSLEYFNPLTKESNDANNVKETVAKPLPKRYLRCPAAVTVFHLQKLIRAKYGLSDVHRVDIMYKEEPLSGSYTLMDVMYIYHWRRKVPLHLSYRIFESSPKRIKLSEDNANYKKSLSNAGINSIDASEEQSAKREWKEVQLKISETGVMSVTDISSPESKRSARVDDAKGDKGLEGTVTALDAVNKSETLLGSSECKKREPTQTTVGVDGKLTNSSDVLSDTDKQPIEVSNANTKAKNAPNDVDKSVTIQQEAKAASTVPADASNTAVTTTGERKETDENAKDNSDGKKLGGQGETDQKQKTTSAVLEESKPEVERTEIAEKKQHSTNNNNNISESKTETHKPSMKCSNENKTNAGSKIDALSAKLQFHPKISQVNNTYSKKGTKEKRTILHSLKKSDSKIADNSKGVDAKEESPKSRVTSGTSTSKSTVSSTMSQQKPSTTVSTQQTSLLVSSTNNYGTTPTVSVSSGQETLIERSTPNQRNSNPTVNVQQALSLLEQRINSPEQSSMESAHRTSHAINPNQKLQYVRNNNLSPSNENLVSIGLNVSAALSQATSTFPYTVHDIVSNTMMKSPMKNSAGSAEKVAGNVSTSSTDHHTCTVPQFNMQTSSMSIYSISTLKNTYTNAPQGNVHAAATSTGPTTTTTPTTRQTSSKSNLDMSGVYSVPPCPDAIPISLMKPTVRKHEIIAKGTNLNEICAKIGTSGSKINDICAKIGENSKEKHKAETRSKADIPDLLKIAKKGMTPIAVSDTNAIKHIPNINVPMYTIGNNSTSVDSKIIYSSVKDIAKASLLTSMSSASAVSVATTLHGGQKIPSVKKQSQPMGYKTLRDPPKSWNPTLSKNNYVAVKNQAKEMQNQTQSTASEGTTKPIQSKPAKIFKMRNMPRYLGNPASGVKPMYGVTNETKEKEQSLATNSTKNITLNMMKIDPKTLSPIVSTVNSPIVSPPPYSPNARSYQNTPFPRDICRNTAAGSPISPRNSPVNMLSTNPFIPSPTPNTNPRLIYSHFPPPFPDASRIPNPLIRSPIGVPPPSAFHSSLPPSINKLYQRSSYIPQTTGYSTVVSSQPPTVQRMPPSSHSSASSTSATACTSSSSAASASASPSSSSGTSASSSSCSSASACSSSSSSSLASSSSASPCSVSASMSGSAAVCATSLASSPKSPKTSQSIILTTSSASAYNNGKNGKTNAQATTSSAESCTLHFTKGVASQQDFNAFNLSKGSVSTNGSLLSQSLAKKVSTSESGDPQTISKQNTSMMTNCYMSSGAGKGKIAVTSDMTVPPLLIPSPSSTSTSSTTTTTTNTSAPTSTCINASSNLAPIVTSTSMSVQMPVNTPTSSSLSTQISSVSTSTSNVNNDTPDKTSKETRNDALNEVKSKDDGFGSKVKMDAKRCANASNNSTSTGPSENQANNKKEKFGATKLNGDVATNSEHYGNKDAVRESAEKEKPVERSEQAEKSAQTNAGTRNNPQTNASTERGNDAQHSETKNEELGKSEQIQGKKSEAQRSKAES